MLLAGVLLAASCAEKLPSEKAADGHIWLSASMNTAPQTRAPYELGAPTSVAPFDASIWASSSGNYQHNEADLQLGGGTDALNPNPLEYHATVYFENSADQLLRGEALYPSDGSTVYFIGLHPNSGWSYKDDGSNNPSTSFDFTGNEDLLYAPRVSGSLTQATLPTPVHPQLHFFHLLTLLRVKIYAQDADVAASWGNLLSMTLAGQQTTLDLDLSSVPDISSEDFATRQGAVADKVTFSGDPEALNFYATGTDNTLDAEYPTGYELPTSATEVAYVLCQPKTASEGTEGSRTSEYTLTLNTANRTGVTVDIDLKTADNAWFSGSTTGRQFTVTLYLKAGGYVAATATVTDWVTGGYINQEVTE